MNLKLFAASLAVLGAGLPTAVLAQDPHAGHDMTGMDMPPTNMSGMDPGEHAAAPTHIMLSPLGTYPWDRDASGTSWQPDASRPMADHGMGGAWTTMSHATLNLVYNTQGGPRGGDQTFLAGMVMGTANRPLGGGVLGFRAMLSPDALMGKEGYPLLLQAGETADGSTHLVDRQHPHDLFMELAATYSHPLAGGSAFVYAGLPGEPAYGPPAFMHRQAAMDSPEAPLSHHWLDSTHITFGVVTAGYSRRNWKLETSAFRGREPDQDRYDIEDPKLDSWSVRASFNPTPNWSAQLSYADVNSPEQLDLTEDETRTSASLLYASERWSGTLAYAVKNPASGETSTALLAEAAYQPIPAWTLFARAEQVEQDELAPGHVLYKVGKVSAGALRDFTVSPRVKIGVGALVSAYDIPSGLAASYGSPTSGMAFVRLKFN